MNCFSIVQNHLARWWIVVAAFVLGLLVQDSVFSQHYLVHGKMAPGVAGQSALMANPNLQGFVQTVKISAPQNTDIAAWQNGGFAPGGIQSASFGLTIGNINRFKISNFPGAKGQALFPSVELLSRLHPPEGQENEFPVPVIITADDIKQVLKGKLVTKVIYLEDPETAHPFEQQPGEMLNTDLSRYEDVLVTAGSLGRPMAILRIGSRQPMHGDPNDEFSFQSPPIQSIQSIQSEVEFQGTNVHPPKRSNWVPRVALEIVPDKSIPKSTESNALPPFPNELNTTYNFSDN